jgi:hypothetical protein
MRDDTTDGGGLGPRADGGERGDLKEEIRERYAARAREVSGRRTVEQQTPERRAAERQAAGPQTASSCCCGPASSCCGSGATVGSEEKVANDELARGLYGVAETGELPR